MSAPPALSLERVVKKAGRKRVLDDVTASFETGSLTLIRGRRGAGKTILARLLAGQSMPDSGRVRRIGLPAPLVGSGMGFQSGAPVARGLELRASAHGLDYRRYRDAVLAFLKDPDVLDRDFGRLVGTDRGALLYASAYLLPAPIYVIDGTPLPGDKPLREALTPLVDRARSDAAVIWIADDGVNPAAYRLDRELRLEAGALTVAS